jgi:hypothetical protein
MIDLAALDAFFVGEIAKIVAQTAPVRFQILRNAF